MPREAPPQSEMYMTVKVKIPVNVKGPYFFARKIGRSWAIYPPDFHILTWEAVNVSMLQKYAVISTWAAFTVLASELPSTAAKMG
jgi:hypothetical protein